MELTPFQEKRKIIPASYIKRLSKALNIHITNDGLSTFALKKQITFVLQSEIAIYLAKCSNQALKRSVELKHLGELIYKELTKPTNSFFLLKKTKQKVKLGLFAIEPQFSIPLWVLDVGNCIGNLFWIYQNKERLSLLDLEPLSCLVNKVFSINYLNIPFSGKIPKAKAENIFLKLDSLPKPHRAFIIDIYLSTFSLEALSLNLKSKRKAKRYLRVMHRKLGLYPKKKPNFRNLSEAH